MKQTNFKLIKGGLDAAPLADDYAEGEPWLNKYGLGTWMLVKSNKQRGPLLEFGIQARTGVKKATRLLMPTGQALWYDPSEFSADYRLFEIVITEEKFLELDAAGALEENNATGDTD